MPLAPQIAHRDVPDTALAYKSFVSPTLSDPYFAKGSADILTSIKGYMARRPGFADALEAAATTFTGLQRIFPWNRWDGTFIVMACDIAGDVAKVYKFVIGTDSSFSLIFTSTDDEPFDFTVSNDRLYFANGTDAKKWDPDNGVQKWGITAPASAPTLSTDGLYAGAAAGTSWTTPANAEGAPDQKYAVYDSTARDYLKLTTFGLAVPTGATIVGIKVTVTGHAASTTDAQREIDVGLTTDGSTLAGTEKTAQVLNLGTDTDTALGSATDLWGNTSLSISDVTATTFGVLIRDADTTAGSISIDAVRVAVFWTITGGITATTGWKYQVCYGNSTSGHISSPSDTSASTGAITNASVGITVTASSDAQVDKIHVFRDTDGGGGNFFEISNSPFSNTSTTVYDATADVDLSATSLAPVPTFNDPPPTWKGVTYWNGRIWGFVDNKVWFSGLEEITTGVPEESIPSGVAGNFYQFDEAVTLIAPTPNALLIFCGGRIYTIQGNSLDTFLRALMTNRRGCRNRAASATLGGMVAWLDSSGQVWSTDGTKLIEVGQDIRPDLESLTPSKASMAFHSAGEWHWLLVSTGAKIFVYDMDGEQWMPPWTVAATCIASGETSSGVYDLMVPVGQKVYKASSSHFNDGGTKYPWTALTGLFNLVPDFGRRFSSIAVGSYDEPSRLGTPWEVGIERNDNELSSVSVLIDDDPAYTSASWIDITANNANIQTALLRKQGASLKQDAFTFGGASGRRAALKIIGQKLDAADELYSLYLAYKPTGGR